MNIVIFNNTIIDAEVDQYEILGLCGYHVAVIKRETGVRETVWARTINKDGTAGVFEYDPDTLTREEKKDLIAKMYGLEKSPAIATILNLSLYGINKMIRELKSDGRL